MHTKRTLIRIVAVALLLYSLWSLSAVGRKLDRVRRSLPPLEKEYALLLEEGALMQARLESGIDDEYIEALARERLGLVKSGDIIFYFR